MDNGQANFIQDEMKLKIPSKIKPPLAKTKCVLNVRTSTSVEEIFRENTMPNLPKIHALVFFNLLQKSVCTYKGISVLFLGGNS